MIRPHLAVLFVLAGVVQVIQTLHLACVTWFPPAAAVADSRRYDTDNYVPKGNSLEELTREHETISQVLHALRKEEITEGSPSKRMREEELDKLMAVEAAIDRWNGEVGRLTEARFYWISGLLIALAGALCMRKFNLILGAPFLIAGFIEMIASTMDFDRAARIIVAERVLMWKFSLSMLTFPVLIAAAHFLRVFSLDRELREESRQ